VPLYCAILAEYLRTVSQIFYCAIDTSFLLPDTAYGLLATSTNEKVRVEIGTFLIRYGLIRQYKVQLIISVCWYLALS